MKANLQRLIAHGTGGVALIVVAAAAGSAITYAVMHGTETLTHLGNSAHHYHRLAEACKPVLHGMSACWPPSNSTN